MEASVDGEERVRATAEQIVRSLGTSKNMKDDIILILSSFDNRFANFTIGGNARLEAADEVICRWGDSSAGIGGDFLPWEESPDEVAQYLAAVDDVISLTEGGGRAPAEDAEVLDRAGNLLQIAMERLEEEFHHIMAENTDPVDSARLFMSSRSMSASFASGAAMAIDEYDSYAEERDDYVEGRSFLRSFSEDLHVEMVRPEAIPHLQSIAERMIRAKYEKECCQVYSSVRRVFLDESVASLGIEQMSIEDVHRIAWNDLNERMKQWAQALKVVFQVLLASEKKLCVQIFEASPEVGEICFAETSKGCVMQLLNFAEAVSIGSRAPEKLFRLLDMYDALTSVKPDLQALFAGRTREYLRGEADLISRRLGDAAKETLAEFEKAVQTDTSKRPMPFGDLPPLTRYVMNYVKLLMDYEGTLNGLLSKGGGDGDDNPELKSHGDDKFSGSLSQLGSHVLSVLSLLESNIEEKSRLYDDGGLHYVFLMNNTQYIVQKVKDTELQTVLGNDWVRKRRGKIRQYSTEYLRGSWTRILSHLSDDGISRSGSSGHSFNSALKEKFKNFNAAFEEICRNQSTWKVADPMLREELRMMISERLIPAYRGFTGRVRHHLESGKNSAKYLKYSPEDLEGCLSDLFEGLSGSSNHSRNGSSSHSRNGSSSHSWRRH